MNNAPHESASEADAVFRGDSDMARRMRAFDWSATALGPVSGWPQSLRSPVSILLASKAQIALFWGPELVTIYNDAYRPVLGAKHPKALGLPVRECWSEIWSSTLRELFEGVLSTGEAYWSRDHAFFLERYGFAEETFFDVSYDPVLDESGRVGGVFCIVSETTARVVAERRLRTLRDLAARSTGSGSAHSACRAAAAVLGANPKDIPFAAIYLVDPTNSVAELAATVGIAPGTPASPSLVELKSDQALVWSIASVVETKKPAVLREISPALGALPTGAWEEPPREAVVLPVSLPGQEVPSAILVAAVSPRRRLDADYLTFFELVATQLASSLGEVRALEEERRRAESLAELDRAKTTFFTNISHEFRTPLTLLLGPTEDALTDVTDPIQRARLELVQRNALRLQKLVNTLLDFARIEAGRMRASFTATDLATLTREIASTFRSAVEKSGMRFIVDCPSLSEHVHVDRDMWEKVVLNLVSNAFKFTLDGEIEVSLRESGERVELRVRDTGAGIAEAELPRLFERFHRVEGARVRTQEGTGIGLALVRELVKLHAGAVSVESRLAHGSTFTVAIPKGTAHLPADRIEAPSAPESTALTSGHYVEEALRWSHGARPDESRRVEAGAYARDEHRGPSTGARPRVVWADDNADMRDYVRDLLSPTCDVESVADGEAALAAVHHTLPDLVLADVMMPRLDGIELVKKLRSDTRTQSVSIILLSARAGEEARIEGLRAGADDYLTKPFSRRELVARVGAAIQLGRGRRELERSLREFLATLAHELRNPLAPIRNSLRVLRMQNLDPSTSAHVHELMERQVDHLVRLVDDLLEVSRITRNRIDLRKEIVELGAILRSAVDTSSPFIEEGGQLFVFSIPPEPLALEADAVRLAQVFVNLLNNAAKYTDSNGQIWLTARKDGDHAAISVRDTGVGIPSEALPRIFDMFMQVDRTVSRAQGGLGIGLTLVRSLVQMHGGTVEVHSEGADRGSEFIVRLPLATDAVLPVARHERPESTALSVCRVLVIDDNQDAADSLGILLKRIGVVVQVVYDGPAALRAVESFLPEVVLLDLGMPGMDGYEVARRVREHPNGKATTLIALTGWGQEEDRNRTRAAGFDHHLIKPPDFRALQDLLVSRLAGTESGEFVPSGTESGEFVQGCSSDATARRDASATLDEFT